MSDATEDLRTTSDALLEEIGRVSALEREKRTVEPRSERFVALARDFEASTQRIAAMGAIERMLAESSTDISGPIDEPPDDH